MHEVLAGADVPVVVDPVMIATAGDRLMREEAVAVYEELLLPGAALLTPNLDEAAVLLRSSVNPGRDELPEAAARLAVRYGCPVLLKGGHLEGDCRDVLSGPDGCLLGQWERPRVQEVSTHGTGCSLSAAVAAGWPPGMDWLRRWSAAWEFISSAIRHHLRWEQPVRVDALKLW